MSKKRRPYTKRQWAELRRKRAEEAQAEPVRRLPANDRKVDELLRGCK